MKLNTDCLYLGTLKKTSKKGNDYMVIRIRQDDSFDYIDLLMKNDASDEEKKLYDGGLIPGDKVSIELDYNAKYKSFTFVKTNN